MKRVHHYPTKLNRDHARPLNAPAPTDAAIEARLSELIQPHTYTLAEQYRRLGLRARVLTLPLMVALVVTLIWRQAPSMRALVRLFGREARCGPRRRGSPSRR